MKTKKPPSRRLKEDPAGSVLDPARIVLDPAENVLGSGWFRIGSGWLRIANGSQELLLLRRILNCYISSHFATFRNILIVDFNCQQMAIVNVNNQQLIALASYKQSTIVCNCKL